MARLIVCQSKAEGLDRMAGSRFAGRLTDVDLASFFGAHLTMPERRAPGRHHTL